MTRRARAVGCFMLLIALALASALLWLHRRPLPRIEGRLKVDGTHGSIEIVRDRWGVPHIFAGNDEDGYFGLGFAAAQDRLFQLELLRDVGQGRLAELFGRDVLEVDRLFRTVDFHGIAARRLGQARPEVRAAFAAYARGINTAVAQGYARRPIELTLLGRDFAPVRGDDFVGVLSYLVWTLQLSWRFDPLYEDLVARIGPERAAALFPLSGQPGAAVFAREDLGAPRAALFDLSPSAHDLLARLPRLAASNAWAVAPQRSAGGHALLANDPHLDIGLPATWYYAHIKTPTQDVAGATIPGLPLVVIGHNETVAWGLTNLMLDSGDFFVERTRGEPASEVLNRGRWVPIGSRQQTLYVKGAPPETLTIRNTPHGPLVSALVPGRKEALAFQWSFASADHTNDFDAVFDLNRAEDFSSFRAAVGRMGGIAQNIVYADRAGHIGLVASGAIPLRVGQPDGRRFRRGWDGSEEWDGFVPFEDQPSVLDPPEGWLAAANNPTFDSNAPPYISSFWEPPDRFVRIREFLAEHSQVTPDDMRTLQRDVALVSARTLVPLIQQAYAERAPADTGTRAALAMLGDWDQRMLAESAPAAVFAVFYKHLFHGVFDDEFGSALAEEYRAEANLSSVMLEQVMPHADSPWFDRVDTPAVEGRAEIVRGAFERAVAELSQRLGADAAGWRWGRMHTLELIHPLGRVRLLAPYFNLGPVAMPGHALTVFKEEGLDADYKIHMGPSLRQVIDLADTSHAQMALPGGQSGVPASRHYGDLFKLWRAGEYFPLLTAREDVDANAEGRLLLTPIEEAPKQ
jgi:penicillin G amidase